MRIYEYKAMNVLITGANGQLGTELRILGRSSENRFIYTDVNDIPGVETVHLDITDIDAVRLVVDSEDVDVIVNCAAYTNVDAAEDDEVTAGLLNAKAPESLADVAAATGATLIHVSTDYVFAGASCTPIRETAPTGPTSVYGRTKLEGERLIANSGCNYIILRTAWLYSPWGRNFVKTMKTLTSTRDEVKVVYDQVGSPTYAADLACAILHIIDSGQYTKKGVYHFTDEGAVSWFDFACAVRELCGNDCRMLPCLSSEFPSKVVRPSYSVLDKSLFKASFGFDIPYWRDSLRLCIERLK